MTHLIDRAAVDNEVHRHRNAFRIQNKHIDTTTEQLSSQTSLVHLAELKQEGRVPVFDEVQTSGKALHIDNKNLRTCIERD